MQKVKITSDGTARNTRVEDAEMGQIIPGAYAFEVSGSRLRAITKGVVFCYAPATEITTEAEIIQVPVELNHRARAIVERLRTSDPEAVGIVEAAFAELVGIGRTDFSSIYKRD